MSEIAENSRVSDIELRELFSLIDTDGSGEIDALEILDLLHRLGLERTHEDVMRMLADVDTDGSGEIDFSEFRTIASATVNPKRVQAALLAFQVLAGAPEHVRTATERGWGHGRLDIENLHAQLVKYGATDYDGPDANPQAQFSSDEILELLKVATSGRTKGNFNYNTFLSISKN